MPGEADSNSPAHWRDGNFFLYNSNGNPIRSQGTSLFDLRASRAVLFDTYNRPHRWIESTYVAPNGLIYAWYHHEPGLVCGDIPLTTPEIGALVSRDGGASFFDLGIVLSAGAEPNCDAQNGYFAGGHGDFTLIADQREEFFYFFFSNYSGPIEQQGVTVARMRSEFLEQPVGQVWKYRDGDWSEPGIGGQVSPIFAATVGWGDWNTDAFWGPSIHWNRYMNQYVILMNRACCTPGWPQEGVYAAFGHDLADPASWSEPVKIVHAGSWYPQVIGLDTGDTDKSAGRVARLFVGGYSAWNIVFDH